MIRTIVTGLVSAALLGLGSCLDYAPAPATAAPASKLDKGCEANRPSFPITFAWPGDTAETVKQVRAANARFAASCP